MKKKRKLVTRKTGGIFYINTPVSYRQFQDSTYISGDNPGVVNVLSRFSVQTTVGTNTKSGASNPDYRVQIAKRTDATTDYTVRVYNVRPCTLFAESFTYIGPPGPPPYYSKIGVNFNNLVRGQNLVSSADDLVLRDLALARLKRKLASEIGNFQVLVPIVELREMRSMINETAKLTTSLFKNLIDIKRTRGKSAFKWASAAWLDFNFGIRPLISDTRAASEAISGYLTRSDFSRRLTGSASKRWFSSEISDPTNTGVYGCNFLTTAQASHELSYRYLCAIDLKLKSGNAYGVDSVFGFTPKDLPSVFWELTPYSWAVDYFTNIGEYLADTFELPPGSTRYLVLNKRYSMRCDVRGKFVELGTSRLTSSGLFPGWTDYDLFSRTKLSSLPHIGLHIKSEDRVGVSAVNRLLNLGSILITHSR